MFNKVFCFAIIMFLFSASAAYADNLVNNIQKKYEKINSLEAQFTQTLVHKESGGTEEKAGKIIFKKPLLVRWEVTNPEEELLLVGKEFIWNVFEDENVAYKYPLSIAQDNQSIVQVITGQAKLNRDFTVKDLGLEDGLAKLELLPHEPTQSLVEANLWVDPATYLIQKLRIVDFYGNINEISLQNYVLDKRAKDSLFQFSLPTGMDLEDRTSDEEARILQ